MANYQTKDIRNIALMGHGSEGKTTLTESLLFAAKAIDRQGRVEDGNTVTDFDPEEIKRTISISAATAPIEWKQKMINVIDIPGYFDFIGEAMGPLRVVETCGIVVSSVGGISVGAEKAWKLATKNGVAKMFIVNQMDREHADFAKVEAQLREKFGSSVVPILLPIGNGADFKGVVNVLENKAYERTNKGEPKEIPVPADMADAIESALEEITEAAASADEELMMKYLDEGELTHEEILEGFKAGMFSGEICPVVPCSALTGVGVSKMLDVIADFLPSPKRGVYKGINPKNDEEVTRKCSNDEPFSAFVFKTIADPFVGKLSLFKVMSGTLSGAGNLYNATSDKTEKVTGLFVLRGKKQIATQQLNAGDMGALNKLQYTNTGDTLCDAANPIKYPTIEYPVPCISKAVFAVKQGEEDKVFSGLARSDAAYAYLAKYPVAPIWGVQRESELDEFLSYQDCPPVMNEELEAFIHRERGELTGDFCRGCGYCLPCPAGIEIFTAARMSLLLRRSPTAGHLSEGGQAMMRKIEDCIHCNQCKSRCPYGLDTPALLKKNHDDYFDFLEKHS